MYCLKDNSICCIEKQRKMLKNKVKMTTTDGLHVTDRVLQWDPHASLNPTLGRLLSECIVVCDIINVIILVEKSAGIIIVQC